MTSWTYSSSFPLLPLLTMMPNHNKFFWTGTGQIWDPHEFYYRTPLKESKYQLECCDKKIREKTLFIHNQDWIGYPVTGLSGSALTNFHRSSW